MLANNVLKKVKDGNFFKGLKLELFEIICRNPGMTVGEVHVRYSVKNLDSQRSRNEIAKRVSDLAALGLIKVSGKRECAATSKKVFTWEPTGRSPRHEIRDDGTKKIIPIKSIAKRGNKPQATLVLMFDYMRAERKQLEEYLRTSSWYAFFVRKKRHEAVLKVGLLSDFINYVASEYPDYINSGEGK